MNQFIQDNTFAIIGILFFIIFLLMGGMIFILYKLLMSNKQPIAQVAPTVLEPVVADKFAHIKRPEIIVEKFQCHNHPDKESVGSCLICEEVFCESCLVEHESMHFCRDHFRIFANSKWKQITDVRTTPDTPEEGLFIYSFKKDMWKEKNLPTFVMTHYKINIDNDYIESFIQLNVREEDAETLSIELEKYKALD